jgi:hypothetical protein
MQTEEIIAQLADTDRRIQAFTRLEPSVQRRTYGPGKWNGMQVLAHIADVDAAFYYRFLCIATQEGATIIPFDEQVWERELRYDARPIALSAALVSSVHANLTHHLSTLPEAALARSSRHPQHGVLTALRMARVTAMHTLHHIGQLDAIHAGREWTKAEALDYWGA